MTDGVPETGDCKYRQYGGIVGAIVGISVGVRIPKVFSSNALFSRGLSTVGSISTATAPSGGGSNFGVNPPTIIALPATIEPKMAIT